LKIKDGSILICNEAGDACDKLDETYLPEDLQTKTRCGITEFTMKE
jgi:hypothetical protein